MFLAASAIPTAIHGRCQSMRAAHGVAEPPDHWRDHAHLGLRARAAAGLPVSLGQRSRATIGHRFRSERSGVHNRSCIGIFHDQQQWNHVSMISSLVLPVDPPRSASLIVLTSAPG